MHSTTTSSSSSRFNKNSQTPHATTTTEFDVQRAKYEDFTTIDWIYDFAKERARLRKLSKQKPFMGFRQSLLDASKAWFVVTATGITAGVLAACILISTGWLSDSKLGYCKTAFYLNRKFCCWYKHGLKDAEKCDEWVEWSHLFGLYSGFRHFIVNFLFYIFFSTTFATISAFMVKQLAPYAAGSGIAEIKTILAGFVIRRFLGVETLIIKTVGLVLSVASGLSIGQEGPLVHVACCCGHLFTKVFKKYSKNEAKKREILSAASAAGVAVAFGAPIGGVLFSLEEVSYYFPLKTLWRSFFCAMVAAVFMQIMNPFRTGKLVIYQVSYDREWHGFELIFFVLLGVFGGLYGALFNRMTMQVTAFRKTSWLSNYPVREITVLALITSIISFVNPFARDDTSMLLGNLFQECKGESYHGICDLREIPGSLIITLLFTALMKAAFTIFTFGTSVPGGVYVPSLAVGACVGRAVGTLLQVWHEHYPTFFLFQSCRLDTACVSPGTYALVGAAATLGGVTRMTVSLVVIMFEVTGAMTYVLPVMIAVMTSKWVGDAFSRESILKGYPFLENKEEYPSNNNYEAQDAMTNSRDLAVIPSVGSSYGSLDELLQATDFKGYPVVKDLIRLTIIGYVGRSELRFALDQCRLKPEVAENTPCHFSSGTMDSTPFVDLSMWMDQNPITVTQHFPMEIVYELFRKMGLRYIVVADNGTLKGLITKKDLIQHLQTISVGFMDLSPYSDTTRRQRYQRRFTNRYSQNFSTSKPSLSKKLYKFFFRKNGDFGRPLYPDVENRDSMESPIFHEDSNDNSDSSYGSPSKQLEQITSEETRGRDPKGKRKSKRNPHKKQSSVDFRISISPQRGDGTRSRTSPNRSVHSEEGFDNDIELKNSVLKYLKNLQAVTLDCMAVCKHLTQVASDSLSLEKITSSDFANKATRIISNGEVDILLCLALQCECTENPEKALKHYNEKGAIRESHYIYFIPASLNLRCLACNLTFSIFKLMNEVMIPEIRVFCTAILSIMKRPYKKWFDFYPIIDSGQMGLVGLRNLGNTCYMNSALQVLVNTPPLTNFFLNCEAFIPLYKSKQQLAKQYQLFAGMIWTTNSPTLVPSQLIMEVKRFNEIFYGYGQQDAQEFLRYILDRMNDEMRTVTTRIEHKDGKLEHPKEDNLSNQEKKELKKKKDTESKETPSVFSSIISDCFEGELESNVRSLPKLTNFMIFPFISRRKEAPESSTYNPFVIVPKVMSAVSQTLGLSSVPIQLKECLNSFFSSETLQESERYRCEKCKSLQDSEKKLAIVKLPEVLIIQLKRFRYDSFFSTKIGTHIICPIDNLDMRSYCKEPDNMQNSCYELFGMINHRGSLGGGHYVAYVKHPIISKWFEYDDSYVNSCTEEEVMRKECYVAFYRRKATWKEDERVFIKNLIISDSSDRKCFISRKWFNKWENFPIPGKISNSDIECPHGAIYPISSSGNDMGNLVYPIPEIVWNYLYANYGCDNGEMIKELKFCEKCKELKVRLMQRRASERHHVSVFTQQKNQHTGNWLFISTVWIRKWTNFLEGNDGPPGPIDNKPLFNSTGTLLPNLTQGTHFKVINSRVWDYLYYTYGGSPIICRETMDIYSTPIEYVINESQNDETPQTPSDIQLTDLESLPLPFNDAEDELTDSGSNLDSDDEDWSKKTTEEINTTDSEYGEEEEEEHSKDDKLSKKSKVDQAVVDALSKTRITGNPLE